MKLSLFGIKHDQKASITIMTIASIPTKHRKKAKKKTNKQTVK